MAYSEDLRLCVVKFSREKRGNIAKAVELFNVSRRSIQRWLNEENQIAGKPGPVKPWKVDLNQLKAAVEQRPDAYLDELAEILKVSCTAVRVNLKRLNITRKKNHAIPRAKRRRTQQV